MESTPKEAVYVTVVTNQGKELSFRKAKSVTVLGKKTKMDHVARVKRAKARKENRKKKR